MATRRRAQPAPAANTAVRILDVAERLVQTSGFNGFSYADIAAELNLTKATLHYHFASKAELGGALIQRYADRFAAALAMIDEDVPDARAQLDRYVALYADELRGQRMCLCGMLAAEYQTLPQAMRDAVVRFFDDNEAWLASVLTRGQARGTISLCESPSEAAQMIISGLEGAMLIACLNGNLERFQSAADRLLTSLTTSAASDRRG
jgi:TetR/AcrR family transcriptional repressor of nem operon